MKTLIIPDIHHKHRTAQKILDKNSFDKLVCLADFFDDFDDTPSDAEETAIWIKEKQAELGDKAVWLIGNHDICYRFPKNRYLYCSGFGMAKSKRINQVLNKQDWDKFKLFHYEQNFYFSHAGISPYIFAHPIDGITLEGIEKACKEALEVSALNLVSWYVAAGESRGGLQPYGGITWLDWSEFEPIKGMNQIVGHTPGKEPRSKFDEDSENWCLDTHLNHFGILEDGKLTIEKVDFS